MEAGFLECLLSIRPVRFHGHLGTAVKHGFLGVDLTAFGAISGRLVLCRPGFSFGPDPEIMGPDQWLFKLGVYMAKGGTPGLLEKDSQNHANPAIQG